MMTTGVGLLCVLVVDCITLGQHCILDQCIFNLEKAPLYLEY